MDGAASVIAIVSVALKSAQMICKIVSGFKNGPRVIQEMASYLRSLSNLLQQIIEYQDSLYLASNLPDLVDKCVKSLRWFEGRLEKLSLSKDNKVERLWKNVKIMLQEKDLDKMSALLQQHIAVLSLQINLLERKRLSSLTESLERVEQQSNKQIALNTTSSNTIKKTNASLDQIRDNIKDTQTISQISSQSTQHALEMMGDKMQGLTGLSEAQSQTLNTILELLQQQFPLKPQQRVAEAISNDATNNYDNMDMKEKVHEVSDQDGLQDALNRLCLLAKEKEKTVFSAEANSIICDIKQILAFLSSAEENGQSFESRSRKRGSSHMNDPLDDRNMQYQHVIKRIKGHITNSLCVAVNEKVPQPWNVSLCKSEFKNTSHRRSSRNGNFIVRTRRKINNLAIAQKNAKNPQTDELEILEASITFVPYAPQTTQIAVILQQRMLYEGSFLKKPILSISALLPHNSPVFSSIESGDLNSLVKMLTLREAHLTDRDSDGRSLLNYALKSARPDICKFLIDEGADVDFIELDEDSRLLLEAGADPTINSKDKDDSDFNHLYHTLGTGTMESLLHILSYGREFVENSSEIDPDNLLWRLMELHRWDLSRIDLLLRLQDNSELHTQDLTCCLHLALMGSRLESSETSLETMKSVLTLLIEHGANIYERDGYGLSVSDYACDTETEWYGGPEYDGPNSWANTRNNHDLRLRNLWAEALSACGYDAEAVISSSTLESAYIDEDVTQDDSDESSPDQLDYSAIENLDDDASLLSEDTGLYSHFDWPLLEEDTNVWRN